MFYSMPDDVEVKARMRAGDTALIALSQRDNMGTAGALPAAHADESVKALTSG